MKKLFKKATLILVNSKWVVMRLIIVFSIIFVLTLIVAFYLYPLKKIELPKTRSLNEAINISEIVSSEFSFRSTIADALQIPLQLKWYDIRVENNAARWDEDCIRYESGEPILNIVFGNSNNPNKYSSSVNLSWDNLNRQYYIERGKAAKFTHRVDETLYYRVKGFFWTTSVIKQDGKCADVLASMEMARSTPLKDLPENVKIYTDPSWEIYATPNLTAWWIKLFILFLIIFSIIRSLLNLVNWAKNGK